MNVGVRGLLGVNNLSFARLGLGSGENCDLKASSYALILIDVVDELTSAEELLDLADERDDVTVVASATTVLNLHHVVCFRVALDLVWLCLHNYF